MTTLHANFNSLSATTVERVLETMTSLQTNDLTRRLVWRGQADVRWGLTSSLFRRLLQLGSDFVPREPDIVAHETDLMARSMARNWYDNEIGYAGTFAKLQHHGAATRFLDVSRDPMVALWFAVQDHGSDEQDAAVFAIDVTHAHFVSHDQRPAWSDFCEIPPGHLGLYEPPWMDERVKSQRAAFIWTVLTGREDRSASFGVVGETSHGDVLIIPAPVKPALRYHLEQNLGIHFESLFPDLDGFAMAHSATRVPRHTGSELLGFP